MENMNIKVFYEKWDKGNYSGCVATLTENYVSKFACNGSFDEVKEALYQIVLQSFDNSEVGLAFLNEIEQWIDEVGVNDDSEGTYIIAETLNGETEVFYNGNYEAFEINFPNLICEMAKHFDIKPIELLSEIRAKLSTN